MISQAQRVAGVAVDKVNGEKDHFHSTGPEAVEALLSVETFDGPIWEPACGDGAISKVLASHGHKVVSSDLVNRGFGLSPVDFLMEWRSQAPNIVTNPPFKLATPFIRKAVALTTGKVALLLRLLALEGIERKAVYEITPLARVWVFSRRIQINRHGWVDTGSGGMTAYAWFVWDHQHKGPPTLGWL